LTTISRRESGHALPAAEPSPPLHLVSAIAARAATNEVVACQTVAAIDAAAAAADAGGTALISAPRQHRSRCIKRRRRRFPPI